MKKPTVILRTALLGLLLPLFAAASAPGGGASSGSRGGGLHVPSMWAAPGVVIDVTPYGIEKWSPGLFVKVSAPVVDALALSVRPSLLYENRAFALRAAVTLDLTPGERMGSHPDERGSAPADARRVNMSPYLGGGIAWHRYGSYHLNPMISGGVDIGVVKRFVFMGGGNLLFEQGDTDLELLGGVGIRIR